MCSHVEEHELDTRLESPHYPETCSMCSVEFGRYLYFLLYTLHISQVLLVYWVYEEVICRGSILCYIVEVHDCDDSGPLPQPRMEN